jgi:hypothetical protein
VYADLTRESVSLGTLSGPSRRLFHETTPEEDSMAQRRAVSLPFRLPKLRLDSIRADALTRPASTAVLILVFALGLGLGAFGHLVMSGDHRATEISGRVDRAEGRAGSYVPRHQLAVERGVLSAEEAQLRSDGIMKGLLVVAVLLLATIAAMVTLWFAVASRREDAHGPT